MSAIEGPKVDGSRLTGQGPPHRPADLRAGRSLDGAPNCSRLNADLPTPFGPWRWMRSRPRTAATRNADGHGRRGDRAVHTASEVRSRRPALARPRPLHPVGRAWLDADLCAALPDRLRAADARRHQELPPAEQPDAPATRRISSSPASRYDRTAGAGRRDGGRNGDRRAPSERRLRRRSGRSLDLS